MDEMSILFLSSFYCLCSISLIVPLNIFTCSISVRSWSGLQTFTRKEDTGLPEPPWKQRLYGNDSDFQPYFQHNLFHSLNKAWIYSFCFQCLICVGKKIWKYLFVLMKLQSDLILDENTHTQAWYSCYFQ